MITIDKRGYFVSGSDTDVGKTYISTQLVAQLVALGITVETRKPAESGFVDPEKSDARKLQQANNNREPLEIITPNRYLAALAPHRAARLEGKELTLEMLTAACVKTSPDSLLVVEGAGGFYSPIAEDGLNADIAAALELPVFIVVDNRIGAVNQSLMSIEAVISRGLSVAAIILNDVSGKNEAGMDNRSDLQAHTGLPVFCCSHGGQLEAVFCGGKQA